MITLRLFNSAGNVASHMRAFKADQVWSATTQTWVTWFDTDFANYQIAVTYVGGNWFKSILIPIDADRAELCLTGNSLLTSPAVAIQALKGQYAATNTITNGQVTSKYFALSDLFNEYGVDNINSWSRLNAKDQTANYDRIQHAMSFADSKIDESLTHGCYTLPIQNPSDIDNEMLLIIGVMLAGTKLCKARVDRDPEDKSDPFMMDERNAKNALARIATHITMLSCSRNPLNIAGYQTHV